MSIPTATNKDEEKLEKLRLELAAALPSPEPGKPTYRIRTKNGKVDRITVYAYNRYEP